MKPDWKKMNDLLPVIVQDSISNQVLMLGYMNGEAIQKTESSGLVTFYSRSKNRLWTKGETSGNALKLVSLTLDCDNDALLCKAIPAGPTCHTGDRTCFHHDNIAPISFLNRLQDVIKERNLKRPEGSYTTSLFKEGRARIVQKIGEEGVELALAGMKDNREEIINESADFLFHMLILLEDSGLSLNEVCLKLQERHHVKD